MYYVHLYNEQKNVLHLINTRKSKLKPIKTMAKIFQISSVSADKFDYCLGCNRQSHCYVSAFFLSVCIWREGVRDFAKR